LGISARRTSLKKVISAMQRTVVVVAASRRDTRKATDGRGARDSRALPVRPRHRRPEIEAIYNPLPNHLHVPCAARRR
jgi:hypothetical protein